MKQAIKIIATLLLIVLVGCSPDATPYQRKEAVIIGQNMNNTYTWADLTYGGSGWITRINGEGYYYSFEGDTVVVQAMDKPTSVIYFEDANGPGIPLVPNGKNAVRVVMGMEASFNFQYPLND